MKKESYLLVTNCWCCGKLTSVVVPTDEGHIHFDIHEMDITAIESVPTYDYLAAEEIAAVMNATQECDSEIKLRRAKNVYNICRNIKRA